MRLIIDNNILFSLLKPNSSNSILFSMLKVEFCAPDFIKGEFAKYENECFLKAKISKPEFIRRKHFVWGKINFYKFSDYKKLIEKAKKIVSDIDDAPYFALALKLNCPIWSNDKELKFQNQVKIFTTEDLVKILF